MSFHITPSHLSFPATTWVSLCVYTPISLSSLSPYFFILITRKVVVPVDFWCWSL